MELVKKNIHMEQRMKCAAAQISLEDDQNISDQKPDAYKIICQKACVRAEETKPSEEAVWIKGILEYQVLYLTDEKDGQLCSLDGSIPFEEKIYTENKTPGGLLRVCVKVEDLSVRLINSRKLNIRSIVNVSIMQDTLYDEEVVTDVEEPQTCEILKETLDVTGIVLDTKDIYRIREEWEIPDGLPNIYSLIWQDISMDGLNFMPLDGKIAISGELHGFFLYEGEEESQQVRCFETGCPFSGILDVAECTENMQIDIDYEMDCPSVEVKPDYDGEERQIDIEIELHLYIRLYQDISIPVVSDAYGIAEKLEPVMKQAHCSRVVKRELGRIKVNETRHSEKDVETEMEILHISTNILEEEAALKDKQAVLTGVLHAEVLGRVKDEKDPYRCFLMDIPYSHTIPINDADEQNYCSAKIYVEQAGAAVQGDGLEVRVILKYQLTVYRPVEDMLLSDMKRAEEAEEEKNLPAMSVYFAKENENLWDVGKRYRVNLDRIRNLNRLGEDIMHEGQKILIVKEMV